MPLADKEVEQQRCQEKNLDEYVPYQILKSSIQTQMSRGMGSETRGREPEGNIKTRDDQKLVSGAGG